MPIQPWDDGPEEVVADDRDEAEERWSREENAYREDYRDRDRARFEWIDKGHGVEGCICERGGPCLSACPPCREVASWSTTGRAPDAD